MSEKRLIYANALIQALREEPATNMYNPQAIINMLRAAPTVPAVVLPCAVGDTVWCIEHGEIYECRVRSFIVGSNGAQGVSIIGDDYTPTYKLADRFGITIFLTREEAEAALRAKKRNWKRLRDMRKKNMRKKRRLKSERRYRNC